MATSVLGTLVGCIFMFFWSAQHALRWGPWHWYAGNASSRSPWKDIAWTLPLLARIMTWGGILYIFYCLLKMQVIDTSIVLLTISGACGTIVYLRYRFIQIQKDPPPH